jgi:hypothetical protein
MEVEEVDDVKELEDSAGVEESCLARKMANFGIAAGRHYTPRRIQGEDKIALLKRVGGQTARFPAKLCAKTHQ